LLVLRGPKFKVNWESIVPLFPPPKQSAQRRLKTGPELMGDEMVSELRRILSTWATSKI
jgi:hypothetical protein